MPAMLSTLNLILAVALATRKEDLLHCTVSLHCNEHDLDR